MGKAVVVKLFYFLVGIFSVAMMFLLTAEPYDWHGFKDESQIQSISLFDINASLIDPDMVSALLKAKSLHRYKDKDEFFDFYMAAIKDGVEHNVLAKRAILKDSLLDLSGDAHYYNSADLDIKSQSLRYDLKQSLASTLDKFFMASSGANLNGLGLVYDVQNGKIEAEQVKVWLER